MNTAPAMRGRRRATGTGWSTAQEQRFGHVVGRELPPGGSGQQARYRVREDETGSLYTFSADDIVTEGFRTARICEQVRFLADHAHPGHAHYVIRLDLPEVEDYYQ